MLKTGREVQGLSSCSLFSATHSLIYRQRLLGTNATASAAVFGYVSLHWELSLKWYCAPSSDVLSRVGFGFLLYFVVTVVGFAPVGLFTNLLVSHGWLVIQESADVRQYASISTDSYSSHTAQKGGENSRWEKTGPTHPSVLIGMVDKEVRVCACVRFRARMGSLRFLF